MHVVSEPEEPAGRRDKRGRRIGYNWWREYNTDLLSCAEAAWQQLRESGRPIHSGVVAGAEYDTGYYQLSDAEFREMHPRPTLRMFLEANAGQVAEQRSEAA